MKFYNSERASSAGEGFAALHIRPMLPGDLAQVHAIDRQSFSLPWPESAYRYELLENKSSFLKVAEVGQPDGNRLVVGAAVVWMILDEAHIATIAVHPQYRGQGIARQMMVEIMQEAIRLGARLATLEVREHNAAAQRLYQRFRFKIVGRRPRYYLDNQEDALIMTVDGLDEAYLDWLAGIDWTGDSVEI